MCSSLYLFVFLESFCVIVGVILAIVSVFGVLVVIFYVICKIRYHFRSFRSRFVLLDMISQFLLSFVSVSMIFHSFRLVCYILIFFVVVVFDQIADMLGLGGFA